MKTPRKQFNELPLPAGWKTPPEGWLFIGMDKDLPRQDGKFMYGMVEWYGPDCYLKNEPNSCGIAAPAQLVRKLSTQKRAARKVASVTEPRLPYDELPLPAGIAPPPSWMCYVGQEVRGIEAPFASLAPAQDGWVVFRTNHVSGGHSKHYYAAPAKLCNRLPSPPESQRVIAAPPKQAEPDENRFEVVMGGICFGGFNTADQAYESAEKMARDKPDKVVYVYQLRAKFTASVNVNRTDY